VRARWAAAPARGHGRWDLGGRTIDQPPCEERQPGICPRLNHEVIHRGQVPPWIAVASTLRLLDYSNNLDPQDQRHPRRSALPRASPWTFPGEQAYANQQRLDWPLSPCGESEMPAEALNGQSANGTQRTGSSPITPPPAQVNCTLSR